MLGQSNIGLLAYVNNIAILGDNIKIIKNKKDNKEK